MGTFLSLFVAALFLGTPLPGAFAGEIAAPIAETAPESSSLYDDIWSLATIYKNDENPVLQKLAFTGRFQVDYTIVDGLEGQDYDDWVIRRWRMGFKANLFEDFTLHSEAEFNPQEGKTFYIRLTDTYLGWSPDYAIEIKAGKQSIPFTADGRTSSKELITIDRSNIANNFWFPEEYLPGVTVGGKIKDWRYLTGIYSTGSISPEFGNFDTGNAAIFSLAYDFSERLNADEALLHLDYLYNDTRAVTGTFTRNLRNVVSLNSKYERGNFGFLTDLAAAEGIGRQSNLFGFSVMPYYNFTDKFQGVLRYTYISSDDPNGIRFSRYESRAEAGRGDRYNEGYLGLNYYFYGHKLKVQTGLKYTAMEDTPRDGGAYYGWEWTTGLRVSW